MKKCELCGKEHDGEYGSGRFCGEHCARSYSTKDKRKEVNKKVSETLKGRYTKENRLALTEEEKINKYKKNSNRCESCNIELSYKNKRRKYCTKCGKYC